MGLVRYLRNVFRHDRNTMQLLKKQQEELDEVLRTLNGMKYQQRAEFLKEKTFHSTAEGITDKKYCDKEIIVSLTTFGDRIYDVYLAIESIMQGSILPNKIVLWISEKEIKGKKLPVALEKQKARGLQICYCEDLLPYTKLVYSLQSYPDACIITIDDDGIYENDVVERLVDAHINNPKAVCACRIHKMVLDKDNKLKSYMDWKWDAKSMPDNPKLMFPTGVGGVLYPPHCFSDEVFNKEVFLSICPYADDVWFYAMELLNETEVIKAYNGASYTSISSSEIDALSLKNTAKTDCRNDVYLDAVFAKYNLYQKLSNK